MKENKFFISFSIVIVLLIVFVLYSMFIFGMGCSTGRKQADDWKVTSVHRSLELSKNYTYCPYCGEKIE